MRLSRLPLPLITNTKYCGLKSHISTAFIRSYSMKFDGPANTLLKADGRPPFIYGTAWKKGETGRLVKEAVTAGFTALDTAAQPRHYKEELFGGALRELYSAGTTSRNDLYVCLVLYCNDLCSFNYGRSKPSLLLRVDKISTTYPTILPHLSNSRSTLPLPHPYIISDPSKNKALWRMPTLTPSSCTHLSMHYKIHLQLGRFSRHMFLTRFEG